MSEKVTVYNLNNPVKPTSVDRDEFYQNQISVFKDTGKPTQAVAVVNVLLFNESGELLVQKRSETKNHNAGLLDKSIGGHVTFGDTPDYTVMVETVQELQIPSIVTKGAEFLKTHRLLKDYLNTTAVIQYMDEFTEPLEKNIQGDNIQIGNKVYLYFGTYSGAVKTVDKEAKGFLFYTIDELEKEISKEPDNFTYDLGYILKRFKPEIQTFLKTIQP